MEPRGFTHTDNFFTFPRGDLDLLVHKQNIVTGQLVSDSEGTLNAQLPKK